MSPVGLKTSVVYPESQGPTIAFKNFFAGIRFCFECACKQVWAVDAVQSGAALGSRCGQGASDQRRALN